MVWFCRLARFVPYPHGVSCFLQKFFSHATFLFTGLDDVLSRLVKVEQRPSLVVHDSVTPAIHAAIRVTWVSFGKKCCPNELIR